MENTESRLYFASDYMEGAHPAIMKKLMETNLEKTVGYGQDPYTEDAKEKIRKACNAPEADEILLKNRNGFFKAVERNRTCKHVRRIALQLHRVDMLRGARLVPQKRDSPAAAAELHGRFILFQRGKMGEQDRIGCEAVLIRYNHPHTPAKRLEPFPIF